MKSIHIKEIGFLLHHGLIDIGRSYKLGIWAIELRWVCPFLNSWSFRIWSGRQKPAKGLIAICIARFYVLSLGDHRPYLRDNLCNMSYRVVFGNVFRIYVFLDGK
jgi:hypothetical protein